jgi:non-lysosomal glucosylceramidase
MNKISTVFLLILLTNISISQIYHRCGTANAYIDKSNIQWQGDKDYTFGSWGYTDAGAGVASTNDQISGTDNPALYQTERYGTNIGYRYDGLRNGIYEVTLKFSELYWTEAGKRVFDIAINDMLCLENLDIFSKAGHDYALDYAFRIKVTNGSMMITIPKVTIDNAKFTAISIIPANKDQDPPSPPQGLNGFKINNRIELNWPKNPENDIQGYNIYKSNDSNATYTKMNSSLIKSVNSIIKYVDSLNITDKIYYKVTAVDASDNESRQSSAADIKTYKTTGNYWEIPKCAWTMPIGYHPNGATGRSKRGIPLGGIGAGNFMYNLCGSFGPWEFKTGLHEEKFLSQAAFHIYEKVKNKLPVIKTLATEDVLSSWNRLSVSEGNYYALYPKAWYTYNSFTSDISLKQFTPIIPHNYKESSYPLGIFQFKLYNPTQDTIELSVMFTFPNADYGNDARSGYSSKILEENGITGLVLRSNSTGNPSTTNNSQWCIATKNNSNSKMSYTLSWNKYSNGSDIYDEFKDDGELNNKELDKSNSAGAIAVKVILPPKSSSVIPFVLSWDFPIVKFGENTEWRRRYTEYFSGYENNSFEIAKNALKNYTDWESKVDQFMNLIINEEAYPDWIKQGSLNELYYDTFGGIFWENGCINKPMESSYGTLPPGDHKYFSMECQDYAMCETFDVRHYECRHYLELFPEIERDVLKWFADYIYNDPNGRAPHDEGAPNGDPFFRFSGYGADWQDMPSKFIQQVYAYFNKTKDTDFLDFVWKACKKTYNFMKTRDSNGNGIPDFGNTTYDTWGLNGDNLLCGGLWIGALLAMEKMAELKNEPALLADIRNNLLITRLAMDNNFWMNDLGYYKIDATSTAIMADGLNGQRYCETTNLEPILPVEKMRSHLNEVFKRCVAPMKDYTGDGIGDIGAVNGRKSDGTKTNNGQGDEVWSGSSYFIAADMYYWGKKLNDPELIKKALQTAYGVYYQTWVNEKTAYFFNTPEAWNCDDPSKYRAQQYQRPRAIWELLLEIKNPFENFYTSSIDNVKETPKEFCLYQNFPNPFNSSTNIKYSLPGDGNVKITIYNTAGQIVETLIDKKQIAGTYNIRWNAKAASGVYFCRIEVSLQEKSFIDHIKLILIK